MSIRTTLAQHKSVVIAAGAALVLLAAYVIPWDSLLGTATAAKGGNNDDNNSDKNQNPNRFKVCEHNTTPQKCYGHVSG